MKDFSNNPCIICNKLLQKDDSISVCPICGTPYHTNCIKETKECVNISLHEKNETYQTIQDLEEIKNEQIRKLYEQTQANSNICSRCNSTNPSDATECNICQNKLTPPIIKNQEENSIVENEEVIIKQNPKAASEHMEYNPYTTPFGGLNPEENIDGVKIKDLACFVGINSHIYLTKFKMMRLNTNIINISALLFNGLYFLYRKMYHIGALILIANIILNVPNILLYLETINPTGLSLANNETFLLINKVFSILQLMLTIFCGFYANKMYKKYCVQTVKQIKKASTNEKEYYEVLKVKGSVNKPLVLVFGVGYVALSLFFGFVMLNIL